MTWQPALKRVVILGASCRAAAQRATLAGWSPLAADLFIDRDLLECAQAGRLEDMDCLAKQWTDQFGPLPLLLAGGMENQSESLERLLSLGMQCGIDGVALRQLRDPTRWAQWAVESGLRWPESHQPESLLPQGIESQAWLLKSLSSAGGLGVSVWNGQLPLPPRTYLQAALKGETLGATFLADADSNHWIGCAMHWSEQDFPAPAPFLYRGNHAPVAMERSEIDQLTAFGKRVRHATGLRGLWQADILRNEDGLWLLEINPRWSASMELLDAAWGLNLVAWHVEAISGGRVPFEAKGHPQTVFGKSVVYADRDFLPTTEQWEGWWSQRWRGDPSELRDAYRFADIPSSCDLIPQGFPILTCIASHSDRSQLRSRLRSGCEHALR